jgi:hypothetical protein
MGEPWVPPFSGRRFDSCRAHHKESTRHEYGSERPSATTQMLFVCQNLATTKRDRFFVQWKRRWS